ncbi:MAG TPA: endonuclease/exonuclease/phosphatase family protein [Xenococcaceae cyanobacterium]
MVYILGYFSHFHRYIEFTINFKLQYLLLGLFTSFFWFLTHRYTWLLVSLLCVLLNLIAIAPWYFSTPNQVIANSQEPTLRLLAFNVLHGNTRYQDAIALVEQEQPDIAAFLEASPPWDTELTALSQIFPYHFSAKKIQIEIYSKIPLNNPQIQVYGNFRGWVIANLNIADNNITFVATHAYPQLFFGDWGWELRNQHLQAGIGKNLGQIEQPTIVIGDLNTTMWSPQYKTMIRHSQLHNTRQGFGILPTQSVLLPQIPWLSIPLDHCLVSDDFVVTQMRTGKNIGSDHLPIIVDVVLSNNI